MDSPGPKRFGGDTSTGRGAWLRSFILVLGAVACIALVAALFRVAVDVGSSMGRHESAGDLSFEPIPPATAAIATQMTATIRSPLVSIAGDIATCGDLDPARQTAALIEQTHGLVMTAGDNAYERGSTQEFQRCYDPSWGRFLDRTRPVPGNHDYGTSEAAGYFDYFGERAGPRGRGYYAFQAGTWRVIALSSQLCVMQGCGPDSEQYTWLAEELAAHRSVCMLAVAHHPRFSSGQHGDNPAVGPLIDLLYRAGADVMVNGHDHDYERLAPSRSDGQVDRIYGIQQFVVGTGGANLRPIGQERAGASEVFDASTHGVLRLRLHARGYDWEFRPVDGGAFTDAGTGRCHARPS